jgi:membrane-associated PAP2 superfamily phosphatase
MPTQPTSTKIHYRTEMGFLFLLLVLLLIIEASHFDLWLADRLYAWMGHAWPYRNHFWTQTVLHDYAKRAIEVSFLLFIGLMVANRLWLKRFRWFDLEIASINTIVTAIMIGVLKATTNVSCPWDLTRYGGNLAYVSLSDAIVSPLSLGNCFPGGHASTAYCFLAFYFVLKPYRPKSSKVMLFTSLLMGLVFDITQQLRGAHFASHGLWTLAIIWSYNLVFMLLFEKKIRSRLYTASATP